MILIVIAAFLLCQILGDPIPHNIHQDSPNIDLDMYPWLASIRHGGIHTCSASILSKSVVLTTAHCANGTIMDLSVQIGRSMANYGASRHRVIMIKCYKNCEKLSSNELALMKVAPPFEFGKNVTAVGLPDTATLGKRPPLVDSRNGKDLNGQAIKVSAVPMNTTFRVAGWSPLPHNEGNELRTTNLRILPSSECRVLADEICVAGDLVEICHGYSGGPLVKNNIQVGLIPWNLRCHSSLQSDSDSNSNKYVDIVYYYDWIKEYSKLLESTNGNLTALGFYFLPALWPTK